MNTLEYYRWPDYFNGTLIFFIIIGVVITLVYLAAFIKQKVSGFVPAFSAIILLSLISLSFAPMISVGENELYIKDGDAFILVRPGLYTRDGYIQNRDLLYEKVVRTISHRNSTVRFEYFVPIKASKQKEIRRYAIFEADCKQYCESLEDMCNVANFHRVEGFHLITLR